MKNKIKENARRGHRAQVCDACSDDVGVAFARGVHVEFIFRILSSSCNAAVDAVESFEVSLEILR